jgi:EAL domain-containing protein (putative c-di-GMP-specific phosphodiesterase class I)
MAVNVSVRQLSSTRLVDDVRSALVGSGLAPHRLTLEVTESVALDQDLVEVLHRLKELGVRLAIDDFGTGYSSLSYLRDLPFDILKVDKSFVDRLADADGEGRALVSSIVSMAADLKLKTVAEGIESSNQLELLRAMSCDVGQGYLFARPLEEDAALDALRSAVPMNARH